MKSCILGGIKTKKEDGTKKTGDEMKKEVADKIIEIFGINNFTKPFTNDVTDAISAAVTFVYKHKNINEKEEIKLNGKKTKKKGNKNDKG
jgi:Holliday junction resolvasome RuvABC endonuclease subunit